MGNFTDLTLDKSKIHGALLELPDCTIKCTSDTDAKTSYIITKNSTSCILIIHHKKDGTTSLQKQGKDAELGEFICNFIKEKTKIFEITEINQSITITDEHFKELLNLVENTYSGSLTSKDIPGGKSYILSKTRDGKFTFNFYNRSKKILLQGKALQFFSLIVNILTDQGYDVFNKILEGSQEIELEESEKLLNEHLPLLAPKLHEQIKNILTPSLQLIKVKTNFPDFSIILFPALKTLEHVIINVLEENNFPYDSRNGFNMFSVWSPTNSYKLNPTDSTQLSGITKDKLEKCYTFYNKQRHGLFHLGSDITEIRTIETQDQAIALLMECIDLMEDISDDFPS
jgi:hypothetical protein